MEGSRNYVFSKLALGLVLLCLFISRAFAIAVDTVKYNELIPTGTGGPNVETFWEIFSAPESGDESTVTFFSRLHKYPEIFDHLVGLERTQLLTFTVFEAAFFTNTLGEGMYGINTKSIKHPPESLLSHKDFAFVDFIKADGKLFFEMRGEHVLVSESSAITLFLLGFIGLYSRRWL